MKKMKKLIIAFLCLIMSAGFFAGCTPKKPYADYYVNFWGWGDPSEIRVFRNLVKKFNEKYAGEIYVTYVQKPSDGYTSATAQAMSGNRGPDVAYVGDGSIKQWVAANLLAPLDEYFDESEVMDAEDIWGSALRRYRVNKTTMQSSDSDPLYAVPKDIGPTVIYYNVNAYKSVGIEIISVDEEDMDAFIAADATAENGKPYTKKGFDKNSMVFNNRIAMEWDDSIELFKLLTKTYNSSSPTEFGYFTEWWFSYGWSVGGDCIEYDETSGNWKFTLGDDTVKYYNKAEDKFYLEPGEDRVQVPTQLDAFTHFVQLSQGKTTNVDGKGSMGYAVTPSPNTLGTMGKVGYFTSGKVASLVDGRFSTVTIRENVKNKFDWDVAPLPKAPGGREAGHSGSMGMCISRRSKVKDAAWKFCEYIAGAEGQAEQASTGFNIPNQKSIAETDVFLQPDNKPKNSSIFLRAAEIQTAGDWWYLSDGAWIDQWAPLLNGDVRNGKTNLTSFFNTVTERTNDALVKYTK